MSRKNPTPKEPDLRAALDLWREDATRAADDVDVGGELADRVVAAVQEGRPLAIVPAGARWYAAAAVLLIAVGIAGTLMVRESQPDASRPVHYSDIQEAMVNVLADDLLPGLEGR